MKIRLQEMSFGNVKKCQKDKVIRLRDKTDFSNTNRILSVVCRNYTTVDRMG